MPAVTLLHAVTLGRQSLAAGVCVEVDAAQASAWAAAGVIAAPATAMQPNQAQALAAPDDDAMQTIAKQAESGKTASKPRAPKRGA